MSMEPRILLVEDDTLIGEMVQLNLRHEGYAVTWLTRGDAVADNLSGDPFDLVVLDVMLPGMDGFAVAASLRSQDIGTPILMLTARADVFDKVTGLDAGADDYLTKPFDMKELLARVRALIRRSQGSRELPSNRHARIGTFTVNFETRESLNSEGSTRLSEKEALLLELFVRNPGRILTRADILEEVWGMEASPTERTVDNFIVRLRKLFERNPDNPQHIITVRGRGYLYKE